MKKYKWYILPLIVLLLVNAAVIAGEYDAYREETIRLGRILAEEPGEKVTFAQAESILEEYGYIKEDSNSLERQFMKACAETAVLSLLLYLVLVISLKRQVAETARQYNAMLGDIERRLEALKAGSYNPSGAGFQKSEKERDSLNLSRLEALIDSLYSSISMVKEEAEQDRRETKEVVTDISHQLKTPLAAIKSTFEMMQSSSLSEEERTEFETLMGFQIASLEKLILSLVNISRLESGMIEIKLTEGSLFDCILDAVNGVWLKADEKNIAIEFDDCEKEKLPAVMRDKKWLTEAFINILDNAVKYSFEHTKISIHAAQLNQMVRIEFKDRGIGISDQEKHSIFKRFYRGAGSAEEEGSGVGLYLARRIIAAHHGTIMVKDNMVDGEKKGSIFVVHLPAGR